MQMNKMFGRASRVCARKLGSAAPTSAAPTPAAARRKNSALEIFEPVTASEID
jgi:hypothetical protein